MLRRFLVLGIAGMAFCLSTGTALAQVPGAGGGGRGIGGGAGFGGGAAGGGGLGQQTQLGGQNFTGGNAFLGVQYSIGAGVGRGNSTVGTTSVGNGFFANPRAAGFVTQPITAGQRFQPGSTSFGSPVINVQALRTTGGGVTAGAQGGGAGAAGGRGGFGGAGAAGGAGGTGFAGGTGGVAGGTGFAGGRAGVGGAGVGNNSNIPFGSSVGARRVPQYLTTLAFRYRPPATPRLRANVNSAISQSTRLPNRRNIQVVMDGRNVILRGTIRRSDRRDAEKERRMAEAMVRLTPGVRQVKNDIQIVVEE